MIIGIDETGDFRDESRSWYVVAFIRPSSLPAVETALRAWERKTRRRLGLANEIKGAQLDVAAADEFITEVVGALDGNSMRWMAYAVDVDDDNRRAMRVQRDLLADGYERWAATQLASDDPERQSFGRVLGQYAAWVRARDERQTLKLLTLTTILPELSGWAFAIAITNGYDNELVDVSFRIDRGYINRSELPMWRDLVRNAFIDGTRKKPIPFSDAWGPDHPVVQAFVEHGRGTTFPLRPSFKERIDFYDSASTAAVRVADVTAAILRNGLDGGPLAAALGRLSGWRLGTHAYTVLQWSDVLPDPGPNPYEVLHGGAASDR